MSAEQGAAAAQILALTTGGGQSDGEDGLVMLIALLRSEARSRASAWAAGSNLFPHRIDVPAEATHSREVVMAPAARQASPNLAKSIACVLIPLFLSLNLQVALSRLHEVAPYDSYFKSARRFDPNSPSSRKIFCIFSGSSNMGL